MENLEALDMMAPVGGGSTKLDSVELVPIGYHICRLFGIVDEGSQLNSKFGKYNNKIRLLFEFPGIRQQFFKDGEISTTIISEEFTRSMSKKGHFRPFVEKALGQKFTDDKAAENFKIFSLIDRYYVAVVSHTQANDKGDVYANIDMISPYDERFAQGIDLSRFNDVMAYYIPVHGFESDAFANLYTYLRDIIRNSEEGVAHSQRGGKFAEPKRDDQQGVSGGGQHVQGPPQKPQGSQPAQTTGAPNQSQFNQPVQGQAVNQPQNNQPNLGNQPNVGQSTSQQPSRQAFAQAAPQLVMISKDYTYSDYIASGWTDESLVANGHAKMMMAPSGPSAPVGPGKPNVQVIAPQSLNALQPGNEEDDNDLPF